MRKKRIISRCAFFVAAVVRRWGTAKLANKSHHALSMNPKLPIGPLAHSFTAPIGVDVKGEVWSCVEMPGSADLFETKKAVRVDAVVDGIKCPNVGLMVTGKGGHMLSISAKLRKQLGKDIGDEVAVRLERRLS
jgi:hypothetical protein